MKSVIDCEGVFEILTRAPFPTGEESDHAVEAHLLVCHDCRRLADALRPAVGLFHEALDEHDSLPEYAGALAERRPLRALRKRPFVQLGPLLIAGAAACLVLLGLQSVARRETVRGQGLRAHAVSASDHGLNRDRSTLAAWNLPAACLGDASADRSAGTSRLTIEVAASPLATVEEVRYLCCTECHRSQGKGPGTKRAIESSAFACKVCHQQPAGHANPLGLFWQPYRPWLWS